MKKFMLRVGAYTLASIMTLTSVPLTTYASVARYTDMHGHWAEQIVADWTKIGVAHGYPDRTFKPDKNISRAEFAVWIHNIFHYGDADGGQSRPQFSDIGKHWALKIINNVVDHGVLIPSEYNYKLSPDTPITRMEMVKMMVRAINKDTEINNSNPVIKYKDASSVSNSVDIGFINIADNYGIIAGYPDGTLQPYANATRAEGSAMLLRLQNYLKNNSDLSFQESDSGWDDYGKNNYNKHDHNDDEEKILLSFVLPSKAHVDEPIFMPIYIKGATDVTWNLFEDGKEIPVSSVMETKLTPNGGTIIFHKTGIFTLQAVAIGNDGQKVSYNQSISIIQQNIQKHEHKWSSNWSDDGVRPQDGDAIGTEKGYGWHNCAAQDCTIDSNINKYGYHKHRWEYNKATKKWFCHYCGIAGGSAKPRHEHNWSDKWKTDGEKPNDGDRPGIEKGHGWHECENQHCTIETIENNKGYHTHIWDYSNGKWHCDICHQDGGTAKPFHEHKWTDNWFSDDVIPEQGDKNGIKKGYGWHECSSNYCDISGNKDKRGYHQHIWKFNYETLNWKCQICSKDGGTSLPEHEHKWSASWNIDGVKPQNGDTSPIHKGYGWHECEHPNCNIHDNKRKDGYHQHEWVFDGRVWYCTICGLPGGTEKPLHEHNWSNIWTTDGITPNQTDQDGVQKGYGWHNCLVSDCPITDVIHKDGYHKHVWRRLGDTWTCEVCGLNGNHAIPQHKHNWSSDWKDDGIRPQIGDYNGIQKGHGWHECVEPNCDIHNNSDKSGYHTHYWEWATDHWTCPECNINGGTAKPRHDHEWSNIWTTDNIKPTSNDYNGVRKGYGWHECEASNCDVTSNKSKDGYHKHTWDFDGDSWSCIICDADGGTAKPKHKHNWTSTWLNDKVFPEEGDPVGVQKGYGWHECINDFCNITENDDKDGYHQHIWDYTGRIWRCEICNIEGGSALPKHEHKWSSAWETDNVYPEDGDQDLVKKGYGWHECVNQYCNITESSKKNGYHQHQWKYNGTGWSCIICGVYGGNANHAHTHEWSEEWETDGIIPEKGDPNKVQKGYGWHECNAEFCPIEDNNKKNGYHKHTWTYNGSTWICDICGSKGGSVKPQHSHRWSTNWVTDGTKPSNGDTNPVKKGYGWHECQNDFCDITSNDKKDGYHQHNWKFNNSTWTCSICKLDGGSELPMHEHNWSSTWKDDGVRPTVNDPNNIQKGYGWHECNSSNCTITSNTEKDGYHKHQWQFDGTQWKCTVCGISGGNAQPLHNHNWSKTWVTDKVVPQAGDSSPVKKGYGWHECQAQFCPVKTNDQKEGYHEHNWVFDTSKWTCTICKTDGGTAKPAHTHKWATVWTDDGVRPEDGDAANVNKGHGWHECENEFCDITSNVNKNGYHEHKWKYDGAKWTCEICHINGGTAKPAHTHKWATAWTDDGIRPVENDANGVQKGYGWHNCENAFCPIKQDNQKEGYHQHIWDYNGTTWECETCHINGGNAQPNHSHRWSDEWKTDGIKPVDGDPNGVQKGHGWHDCDAEFCPIKNNSDKNGYHKHTWNYDGTKWECPVCHVNGGTAKPQHIHNWSHDWKDDGVRPQTNDVNGVQKGYGWHECKAAFCTIVNDDKKDGYHKHTWNYNGTNWTCNTCGIDGGTAKPQHNHNWASTWTDDGVRPQAGDPINVQKGYGWHECQEQFCPVTSNNDKNGYHQHNWSWDGTIWSCSVCHINGGNAQPQHNHNWASTWTDDGVRPQNGDANGVKKGYGWHDCQEQYCPVSQNSQKDGYHQHIWNWNDPNWECTVCHINGGTAIPAHTHNWQTTWATDNTRPALNDREGVKKGYGWHECLTPGCTITQNSQKSGYHQHEWLFDGFKWKCKICGVDGGNAAAYMEPIHATKELNVYKFHSNVRTKTGRIIFLRTAYSGDPSQLIDVSEKQDKSVLLELDGDDATVYAEGGCLVRDKTGTTDKIPDNFGSYHYYSRGGSPFCAEYYRHGSPSNIQRIGIYAKEIDARGLDVSNLSTFDNFFYGLSKLQSVNISSFNTSKSKSFETMFSRCEKLENIVGLDKMDTSNATKFNRMFEACKALSNIDVTKFNTAKATTMERMFYYCQSLKEIDVTSFNTYNVTTMGSMFYGCSDLEMLDLSSFNTTNLAVYGAMFNDCYSVTEAYARKQYDAEKFNASVGKPSNVNFTIKTGVHSLPYSMLYGIPDLNSGTITDGVVNTPVISYPEMDGGVSLQQPNIQYTEPNVVEYNQPSHMILPEVSFAGSNVVEYNPYTPSDSVTIHSNIIEYMPRSISFANAS